MGEEGAQGVMDFADISITDLIGWIIGGIAALSVFVEISPIKLNPWSWIAKRIGRAINAEVIEKVDKLENDLEEMKNANEEQTAKENRAAILRFGDELRMGIIKHSKESFDNVLITISDYDTYCENHPAFRNKITEINEKYIADVYDDCLRNNKFL
jgi:hypothetical protein